MVVDSFQKKLSIAVTMVGIATTSKKESGLQYLGVVLVRKWYEWLGMVL